MTFANPASHNKFSYTSQRGYSRVEMPQLNTMGQCKKQVRLSTIMLFCPTGKNPLKLKWTAPEALLHRHHHHLKSLLRLTVVTEYSEKVCPFLSMLPAFYSFNVKLDPTALQIKGSPLFLPRII